MKLIVKAVPTMLFSDTFFCSELSGVLGVVCPIKHKGLLNLCWGVVVRGRDEVTQFLRFHYLNTFSQTKTLSFEYL